MTESVATLGTAETLATAGARPTADLPVGALIRISAFWLGLTSIDAVVNATIQARLEYDDIVTPGTEGMALAFIAVVTFVFSVAVQPTVGSLSDYTTTRWGRRKPYIVFGALLDVVFLIGIATANTLVAIAAFVTLLQFSTNTARGAFQGYVPDLVPDRQVGLASAMVGLMQVFGNVLGFALAAIALSEGNVGLAVGAIAVVELVTMLSVVLRVPKGPPAKSREGRSWLQIAAAAWGTDILKERSYVWLLISRLFILMGGAGLVNFVIFYLGRSLRIPEGDLDGAILQLLAAATLAALVSIIPASRLSDRIGRKPVIWGCTAFGMIGLVMVALAPNLTVATIGAALLGSSQGTFLSVDWALMTDIIPKAASGRYMGLSNVVTASSTTIAVAVGGLTMDAVGNAFGEGAGPRTVMLLGIVYFTLGAIALRPVVEPRRGRASDTGLMPRAPGTP